MIEREFRVSYVMSVYMEPIIFLTFPQYNYVPPPTPSDRLAADTDEAQT